jgi:DNA repair protein RecO (recombination protein O)
VEWRDEGLIIGLRRHGEGSVILEAMTRNHGRHLGIVRQGRGQRAASVLQLGNRLSLTWRARLEEHLGGFAIEPLDLPAGRFLANAAALYGLSTAAALTRLLPERDPHTAVFDALSAVIAALDEPAIAGPMIARYELAILSELGFGLALDQCAVTGGKADLVYVSPRTGRAVSAAAGEAYRDRLFSLPGFLAGRFDPPPDSKDLRNAFALTGHFLERNVVGPRGLALPEERGKLIEAVLRAMVDD